MNIYCYFYFKIARDVITVVLVFVEFHQLNHTFSHAHIEERTHKQKCMISAQEEWRETGAGAWLEGAEERFLLKTKS